MACAPDVGTVPAPREAWASREERSVARLHAVARHSVRTALVFGVVGAAVGAGSLIAQDGSTYADASGVFRAALDWLAITTLSMAALMVLGLWLRSAALSSLEEKARVAWNGLRARLSASPLSDRRRVAAAMEGKAPPEEFPVPGTMVSLLRWAEGASDAAAVGAAEALAARVMPSVPARSCPGSLEELRLRWLALADNAEFRPLQRLALGQALVALSKLWAAEGDTEDFGRAVSVLHDSLPPLEHGPKREAEQARRALALALED